MATVNPVVPPTPANGVLSTFQDFANVLGSIGEKAAGIYSTVSSADAARQIANAQAANTANAGQLAALNAEAGKNTAISLLVYAGIGLAAVGTFMVLYKKFK